MLEQALLRERFEDLLARQQQAVDDDPSLSRADAHRDGGLPGRHFDQVAAVRAPPFRLIYGSCGLHGFFADCH